MTQPKQFLYKTAFSPQFNCFVAIDRVWQDFSGEWIYSCSFKDDGVLFEDYLFRGSDLTNFVL